MSLVAYGSSDESSDEEELDQNVEVVENITQNTRKVLSLPAPRDDIGAALHSELKNKESSPDSDLEEPALFKNLPKPRSSWSNPANVVEDDIIPPKNDSEVVNEQRKKKSRGPVRIALPSLSQFKDVEEEEEEKKRNKIKPSEKGTGLFAILPPPKSTTLRGNTKLLIPHVVTKKPQESKPSSPQQQKNYKTKALEPISKVSSVKVPSSLSSLNYDSDSEDESDISSRESHTAAKIDFFSLSETKKLPASNKLSTIDFFSLDNNQPKLSESDKVGQKTVGDLTNRISVEVTKSYDTNQHSKQTVKTIGFDDSPAEEGTGVWETKIPEKVLTSNVMNLPRDEIKLKNKAEVGPKLPVPEQDYNIDSQGNVAFDEKAIEYLCGKRGVKRKDKDFDEANIIEINGEDIKPDEREWLVKALTEEPAERPVSMQSAGPSSQSKKKHQITYLAHQAKAMEFELKNQWAQNRMTKKQTQSKYGF